MPISPKGIIPALVTPYGPTGEIDDGVTRKLVDHLVRQGVGGLYVGGTTGEGLLQGTAERTAFTALVAELANGQVPVVAHVGAADTATCIDLARYAAAAGASAVSAVVPFYYPHGREQIRGHFLDIADGSPLPFLPYYLPTRASIGRPIELFIELAEHENIDGFKYTSRDVFELQQMVELCGDQVSIFNGADEVCVHGLLSGAAGAIGSTYNFMASQFVRIVERLEAGDVREAITLQAAANAVIRKGSRYDNVAFARAVLQAQGFGVGPPRKPLQQLSTVSHSDVAALVAETPFLQ